MRIRTLTLALCAVPCAFGYIGETYTTSGATPQTIQVTHTDNANLQFYLNSGVVAGVKNPFTQSTAITASSNPAAAVQTAMASWNNVGVASIRFNALQSTTAGRDSNDCKNVITMAATVSDLSILGFVSATSPGVVAVTANSYVQGAGSVCGGSTSVPAGSIIDSDILLNPYVAFSTDSTAQTQDLQAVITHELGHVLGMNHSSLLGATMYPFAAKYQRHLSWDEKAFVAAYYPSGKISLGTIAGTVTLASAPVSYGLITLTELSGIGRVFCTLTGIDGKYSIQLPPGVYNVYAEPFNSFIGANSIYSLTNSTGLLDSTKATTAFGATLSGGNSTNPPTFTVTSGSTSTADIAVTAGATTLAAPFFGIGKAGVNGGISTFNSIAGAIPVTAGTSLDIAFAGPGIDSTLQLFFIGTNVDVGAARLDPTININGNPVIRFTLTVGSQTYPTLGTLWLVKGTTVLPLSGILDIEPSAPVVNNVQDAESARTSITSGQYVAIYGANLADKTRIWGDPDFTGGVTAGSPLPTSLDGISVTVNGVPAAVFSTSPSQINFISPSNLTPGPGTVVVSNYGSSSTTFNTTIALASPSFFIYGAGGNYYPSAVHLDAKLVGDPAALNSTVKAHPGETILMFANGLQPASGNVVVTPAVIDSSKFTLTAGSTPLTIAGAALVYAGEYQLNVTIPATLAAGNYPLTLTVPNGSTATSGLSIPVTLSVGP